jgi:uncharacterized protein (DUF302 family)
MKKILYISFILISATITAIGQTGGKDISPVMIESQSKYGFAATVDSLSKAAIAGGWKVTIVHDLQETMKKNGKEVLPVKVMEICNPMLAYQILSKDELRDNSSMLPCRISVYEKADGKTYVSRMNTQAFTGMIDAEAARTVSQAFTEAEKFIKVVTL